MLDLNHADTQEILEEIAGCAAIALWAPPQSSSALRAKVCPPSCHPARRPARQPGRLLGLRSQSPALRSQIGAVLGAATSKQKVVVCESYGGEDEPVDILQVRCSPLSVALHCPRCPPLTRPALTCFRRPASAERLCEPGHCARDGAVAGEGKPDRGYLPALRGVRNGPGPGAGAGFGPGFCIRPSFSWVGC